MRNLFKRIYTRSLIIIFIISCLFSNAVFADAIVLEKQPDSDCLAPVSRISSFLLQKTFLGLPNIINDQDFPDYIAAFSHSTKPFSSSRKVTDNDLDDLALHLKNISSLIKILEDKGLAFSGILSAKEKTLLDDLFSNSTVIQGFRENEKHVLEAEEILINGLKVLHDLRNLQVNISKGQDYKFYLNRLERKFIQAKNIISAIKLKLISLEAPLKEEGKEELFSLLTQALIERDVDVEYAGTILIKAGERGNIRGDTKKMIDAADEIAAFIHIFEQERIGSDYINFMLETLISSKNAGEMILIVSDQETALNIARLIKRFEAKDIDRESVKPILETILSFTDVKHRSSVLESFFNSPELQFMGKAHRTTMSILTHISHLDNIGAVVEGIKSAVGDLEKSRELRKKSDSEFYKLKKKGEFERSIVSVCDEKGNPIGSAWVLEENEESYSLVSNNHVIDEMNKVLLKTHTKESSIIGEAYVVYSYIQNRHGSKDMALLEIMKHEVKGGPLKPLKMLNKTLKAQQAVLVSGYDMNDSCAVSSGELVLAGEFGVLIGAKSRPGNSGSPVLVKMKEGYRVVAIHVAAGPISILLEADCLV